MNSCNSFICLVQTIIVCFIFYVMKVFTPFSVWLKSMWHDLYGSISVITGWAELECGPPDLIQNFYSECLCILLNKSTEGKCLLISIFIVANLCGGDPLYGKVPLHSYSVVTPMASENSQNTSVTCSWMQSCTPILCCFYTGMIMKIQQVWQSVNLS